MYTVSERGGWNKLKRMAVLLAQVLDKIDLKLEAFLRLLGLWIRRDVDWDIKLKG